MEYSRMLVSQEGTEVGEREWVTTLVRVIANGASATSGVGLGLSVARGFVEAMGGAVAATDTPGGGLTVVVDLATPPGAGR